MFGMQGRRRQTPVTQFTIEIERIRDALVRLANDGEVGGMDYSVLNTSRDESGATVLVGDKYGLLRAAEAV